MVPGQRSLSQNVRKTKELIVDFRKRQQRSYTPLMTSGTPVERVSSFKYLGVNISEDLTWTTHIQTQVKKARQRLYHLRQLRKFRVSPAILKTFYSGAIESVNKIKKLKKHLVTIVTQCQPENTHGEFQSSNRKELLPKSPPFHAKGERVN